MWDGHQIHAGIGGAGVGGVTAVLVQLGIEEDHAADQGREGDELQHGDGHQVHSGGGGGSVHVQVEENATNQG